MQARPSGWDQQVQTDEGLPERGGQELIFMVGCGYIEDGEWSFKCFTTEALNEPDEARVIDQWFEHMQAVRDRLGMESKSATALPASSAAASHHGESSPRAQRRPSPRGVS